jgi:hypothetical protein
LSGHGFAEWSISMSIASDLLERHIQTLVADPAQWQTLIADDMVWELAYAPAIGHPSRLTGRDEITRHVISSHGFDGPSINLPRPLCVPHTRG